MGVSGVCCVVGMVGEVAEGLGKAMAEKSILVEAGVALSVFVLLGYSPVFSRRCIFGVLLLCGSVVGGRGRFSTCSKSWLSLASQSRAAGICLLVMNVCGAGISMVMVLQTVCTPQSMPLDCLGTLCFRIVRCICSVFGALSCIVSFHQCCRLSYTCCAGLNSESLCVMVSCLVLMYANDQ